MKIILIVNNCFINSINNIVKIVQKCTFTFNVKYIDTIFKNRLCKVHLGYRFNYSNNLGLGFIYTQLLLFTIRTKLLNI